MPPYHSPNKFRHGHIHYGLKRSKDIADFKAVSQNVMHSSMEITDQFYSVQNDEEVKKKIDKLSENKITDDYDEEQIKRFETFKKWEKEQR